MFTKPQEEYLKRKLKRNEVVLFLGAGFSLEAININDKKLPTGSEFAEKIWKLVYKNNDYDGTALSIMYDLLLTKGLSNDIIETFLKENFSIKNYPEFYNSLTIPFWYKIYTTNIDNLLDKIYLSKSQRAVILKYPKDEHKDIDKSLDSVQHIYLNGKIPCKPNELIFSKKQYASASNKLNQLYNQFVLDYSTTTTIILGSSLDEPLFEQYLSARQERKSEISENRPLSFLIDPYIKKAKADVLKSLYNIVSIKVTTEEFLKWIKTNEKSYNDKIEIIRVSNPSLIDLIERLSEKDLNLYRKQINDFSEGFRKVNPLKKSTNKTKAYLQGTSPTWNDILNDLDAPRKISSKVFEEIDLAIDDVENKVRVYALLGSAGCGKSTILKRLGLNLAKNGRTTFLSYSEYMPDSKSIISTLNTYDHRICLLFDNADLMMQNLSQLIEEVEKCNHKPILILTSRTNVFDRLTSKFNILSKIKEFHIPNLDKDEIIEVIRVLEENNLLGHMKGMTDSQRILEFEKRAKKQILVAMREATKGENFDVIIKSEFEQISPIDAKFIAGCVALTTEAGFTISIQDAVSFSSATPAESLHYLERNLKNIVITAGEKGNRLLFRHRAIADYIVNNCMSVEQLKNTYLKILTSLAPEINIYNWKSRKFALYREIINHYKVYKRFRNDINNARELYESLIPFFNNDFHLWLQYGALEMEGKDGDLDLAENYILQAESIRPNSLYVKNALANLYFKKSRITQLESSAIEYRKKANEIIMPLIEDIRSDDAHTYHIYCKGNYEYITKKYTDRKTIRDELNKIKEILDVGISSNSKNRRLNSLSEILTKAILMTAVSGRIKYPVIFGSLENE